MFYGFKTILLQGKGRPRYLMIPIHLSGTERRKLALWTQKCLQILQLLVQVISSIFDLAGEGRTAAY